MHWHRPSSTCISSKTISPLFLYRRSRCCFWSFFLFRLGSFFYFQQALFIFFLWKKKTPAIFSIEIMQGNSITSLGKHELARLSPSLSKVFLDRNPVYSISDGFLDGLQNLTKISWENTPSHCEWSLVEQQESIQTTCHCAPGYATEQRSPTFCGLPLYSFFFCQAKTLPLFFLPPNYS